MVSKPIEKPSVSVRLNPFANGRLTIRQDKTKQDKAGFGSSNQNQNPPFVLVSQPDKHGFFSCPFFCRRIENAKTRTVENEFSTAFAHSFPQSGERGCV